MAEIAKAEMAAIEPVKAGIWKPEWEEIEKAKTETIQRAEAEERSVKEIRTIELYK